MSRKRILIISPKFYPENTPRAFRASELAKEFSKIGHNVVVYTYKQNLIHEEFEKKYGLKIKDLGERRFKKNTISNAGGIINLFVRVYNRILLMLFEYPDIEIMFHVKNAIKKEKNYDLIISNAVPFPTHWGVAWARSKKNKIAKVWVADCGDPFYFNTHDSFKKLFYFKYVEKWFSKKADYISIPFIGLKKYFLKEFNNKYVEIPQGFNLEEIKLSQYKENKTITFAYAGSFIKNARDPRLFLNYLSELNIPFNFILYNQQPEFTDPYKEKLKGKLIVKNYIPRDELLYKLSKVDFLVNFEFNQTNQVPSKLIDYLITKRPILLLERENFNKKIINQFLERDYTHKFDSIKLENYNIKKVTNQFLQLLKNE